MFCNSLRQLVSSVVICDIICYLYIYVLFTFVLFVYFLYFVFKFDLFMCILLLWEYVYRLYIRLLTPQ